MAYRMRNDMVLVRVVDTGKVGSVLTPQKSAEGKEYFVEAVGDKVLNLKQGDKVFIIGNTQSLMFLPDSKDLFITSEANVVMVYEKEVH